MYYIERLGPGERRRLYEKFAEEFRTTPIGEYSLDLQRVLNLFRGAPTKIKYGLVCTKNHEEWVLAMMPDERGKPVQIFKDKVFARLEDAECEVFNLRWKAHFGSWSRRDDRQRGSRKRTKLNQGASSHA